MVGGPVVLGDRQVVGKSQEVAHPASFPVRGLRRTLGRMTTHAAFLRGMNLGGRRITNKDLGAAVSGIGFEQVETFRASGNVVFAADRGTEPQVAERLETGLADALGYEVPVFLRSAKEIRAIAAQEPFEPAQLDASKGKLQVVLLLEKPPAKARREALALATDDDLARARWTRALLAAEWRACPTPSSTSRESSAALGSDDDPDDGHGRADRGQVFRRLEVGAGQGRRARSRS